MAAIQFKMTESPLIGEFNRFLSPYAEKPVMIHSDLFSAMPFVDRGADRNQLLNNHLAVLQKAISPKNIWMPAFNYQFPKTRFFDVVETVSELGPLNEYFRTRHALYRTLDPVFSFCSNEEIKIEPPITHELVAFSRQTAFQSLDQLDGSILFYGAPFGRLTMIHHIEHRSGGPLYRYDKIFDGKIKRTDGITQDLRYIFHVRPAEKHLDYDWEKLQNDLIHQGILKILLHKSKIIAMLIEARQLIEYWLEQLKKDPFYLLNTETRAWVEPFVNKLGRRVQLSDFEKETP